MEDILNWAKINNLDTKEFKEFINHIYPYIKDTGITEINCIIYFNDELNINFDIYNKKWLKENISDFNEFYLDFVKDELNTQIIVYIIEQWDIFNFDSNEKTAVDYLLKLSQDTKKELLQILQRLENIATYTSFEEENGYITAEINNDSYCVSMYFDIDLEANLKKQLIYNNYLLKTLEFIENTQTLAGE